MKKIIINAVVLAAFSLVLGFLLGAVYDITKGPIAEATRKKEMAAYKVVFADADDFTEAEINPEAVAAVTAAGYNLTTVDKVFVAIDKDKNEMGYVVQLTTNEGYNPPIVIVVGIRNDGTLNGFSVTSHNETPGFGAEVVKPDYANKYNGIAASEIDSVEGYTGATVTTKAVKRAMNAAVVYANSLAGGEQ